ncbi:MAG: DUF5050 domain-containing protein [Mobilitalea sp.]
MLKKILRILIIMAGLTIVGLIALLLYSNGRTYFNEDTVVGNTSGNLYNGGLFCENDNKIYFSNDTADGSLYAMNKDCTIFEEISLDKSVYINVDDNYIYYVRANDTRENLGDGFLMFYNTGVLRVTKNGHDFMSFTGDPAAHLNLFGNFVYYQRYDVDSGWYLYRNKIDDSQERLLVKDTVVPIMSKDNLLYYTGFSEDHNINAIDLDSFTSHTMIPGNFQYPIFIGGYIYYIDLDDKYKICRMDLDGSNRTVIVDERCFTYNITNSGQYLYYQVDDTKNNRIARINLATMQEEKLLDGNYKQIHVTENYVFFKDFDSTNTYIMSADGINDISTFNPPDLRAAE